MTAKYRWTAKVRGQGFFPIDMLRYDSCYPADQDSVFRIGSRIGMDDLTRETREVTVECISGKFSPFTVGRWDSFGWQVLDVKNHGKID